MGIRGIILWSLVIMWVAVAVSAPAERNSVRFIRLDREARQAKEAGNYLLAEKLYDEALSIPASAKNLAIVKLNKSDLLVQTGQYQEAERLLRSMTELTDELEVRRISNLSSLYVRTGRAADAESLYRSLLDSNDLDSKNRSLLLQNLGYLYLNQGRWEDAYKLLTEALAIADESTILFHIMKGNLAMAESLSGRQADAENHILQSYKDLVRMVGKSHPDALAILRKMGEIYLHGRKFEEAKKIFSVYFISEKSDLIKRISEMNEQQRLDYWKMKKQTLSLVYGLETEDPSLLFDLGVFRRGVSFSGKGGDDKNVLATSGSDIRKVLSFDEMLVDFAVYPKRREEGLLEDFIGACVVTVTDIRFVPLGKVSDLKAYRIGNSILAKMVSSENPNVLNALYSDKGLTERIWDPILSLAEGKKRVYFIPDGIINTLGVENLSGLPDNISFHRLTSPLTILKRNKAERKVNSNRHKLLLGGGFDFDKEDNGITADSIKRTEDGRGKVNYSEVSNKHEAADFLKDEVPGFRFSYLPGSGKEVEEISKIYLSSTKLNDIEEEDFGKLSGEYGKIHIATHGYTLHLPENRNIYILEDSITMDRSLLASGLVMTGANRMHLSPGREDGLISAREMCDYDLTGVDFFVLSACRTADGEVTDEGPAGLVRGLKRAGVKTILAALWEVNDEAAMIFMRRFYELQVAGLTASQAYEGAKKYLREYVVEYPEIEEVYNPATMTTEYVETENMIRECPFREPFMWAPFVLIDGVNN